MYPAVAWVALLTEEITDTKGPIPIKFEMREKQTVMPLGDHAAHWSSYIGEVIRGVPLYYPFWLKVLKERKAMLITDIGAAHGIPRLDIDKCRHPAALAKGVQYQQGCFRGPSLGYRPHDQDLQCQEDQRQTSTTQEYPSLINTFFVAHIVNEEFLRDKDRRIYLEEGSSEGTLPMWVGYCKHGPRPAQFESGGASESGGCGDEEEGADHQDDEDEDGDGDT
nr:hypothetical protein [Tanacetum cinerariifolium]